MKINIVCYEDLDTWICGKIAKRLNDSLLALGHEVTLGTDVVPSAEINHHIIYLSYAGASTGVHTLMVTHIDNALKLGRLKEGLKSARAAVCMSREGVRNLIDLGVDPARLDYAHMGQDGKALPRRVIVGISTRLYPDGRKNESDFERMVRTIRPDDFAFKIMGFGWASIVDMMKARGFEVDYRQDFDYDAYLRMLSTLDYFMYLGGDEGSAAFIDALAAGVKTIVQPQGFHLDAPGGITHPFRTYEELEAVMASIAGERRKRVESVAPWTWENYARKHLDIWERCLAGRPLAADGEPGTRAPADGRVKRMGTLWWNVFAQRFRLLMNLGKDFECGSRLWDERMKRKKAEQGENPGPG